MSGSRVSVLEPPTGKVCAVRWAAVPLPTSRTRLVEEFGPRRGQGYNIPRPGGVRAVCRPVDSLEVTRDVATAAGIEGWFSTHVLRHTSLTTALDATDNLRAVMAFARHNKPDVTARYTSTSNEQLRRVSDALKF